MDTAKMTDEMSQRVVSVGKVVENGKAFETTLHQIVAGFISADRAIANVAASGNVSRQIGMLKAFGKICDLSDEARRVLTAWIRLAEEGARMRNAAVHTVWCLAEDGAEFEISKGMDSPLDIMKVESLAATIQHLRRVIEDASDLTRHLVQQPCWHGSHSEISQDASIN